MKNSKLIESTYAKGAKALPWNNKLETKPAPVTIHHNSYDSYKQKIKGFIGPGYIPALNSDTLLHYNTKSVVYSFNKVNNLYPLLTKTEYLLKSLFRSMFSLISRPIYLLKHDKIVIQLFVFLSPKYDKFLDTCTRDLRDKIFRSFISRSARSVTTVRKGASASILTPGGSVSTRKEALILKKMKNLRPKIIEILLEQMHKRNLFNYKLNLYELSNRVTRSRLRMAESDNQPHLTTMHKKTSVDKVTLVHSEVKAGLGNSRVPTIASSTLVSNFKTNLERLSIIFGKIFNKKVEFQIIKAQLPFQDSNILAQILGYNANKYKFRRMLKILIPRAVIKNPSIAPLHATYTQNSGSSVPFCFAEKLSSVYGGLDIGQMQRGSASAGNAFISPSLFVTRQNAEGGASCPVPRGEGAAKAEESLGAKNLKLILSQPSSYLPPFFYSKCKISLPWFAPLRLVFARGERDKSSILKRQLAQQGVGIIQSPALEKTLEARSESKGNRSTGNKRGARVFPSYLSGMNIKLAGRLMTQSMRPRFTVQSLQEGSLARVKVHYLEKSRFTGKNKRGAFSFTVTISHVFN